MFKTPSLKPQASISAGAGAGMLATLALLLLSRLYEGLRHDAALYFGQVLHRGGELDRDPFFVAGSQDSFSVYSRVLSPAYDLIGPAVTHQGLLLLGMAGSALAIWTLLRRMGLLPMVGLLAVATLSPMYGGLQKFGFTENFVTARTLAEPLVLFSLLPLMRGRLLAGLVLQIIAAAFHPLMALPALVITWFLAIARDRRWLFLLTLPVLLLIPAFLGFAPLKGLSLRFDPYWWALVSQSNVQTVLANWNLSDWLTVLTDAAVIASVARRLPEPHARRLLLATLTGGAGLTAFAAVATDGLHWVLPTQLQLWRSLWLVHLLALAVAPWLAWQLWTAAGLSRLSAGLLVLALLSSHAASSYGAPVLAGWALCNWGARRRWSVSDRIVQFSLAACFVGGLGLSAAHLLLQIERMHWHPVASELIGNVSRGLTEPAVAFTLLGALLWLGRQKAGAKALALLLSASLASFAVLNWDQRDALARAIESPPQERPFQALIPEQATVFWPEYLAGVWGLLGRVSHFLPQQGAGMLFNRETAEIIGPRRETYRRIIGDREGCEAGVWLQRGSARDVEACLTPSMTHLQELCSSADHPDYLVFGTPLRAPALARWDVGDRHFYLYPCSQFAPVAEPSAVQNERPSATF